jgi:hypothetical protein
MGRRFYDPISRKYIDRAKDRRRNDSGYGL